MSGFRTRWRARPRAAVQNSSGYGARQSSSRRPTGGRHGRQPGSGPECAGLGQFPAWDVALSSLLNVPSNASVSTSRVTISGRRHRSRGARCRIPADNICVRAARDLIPGRQVASGQRGAITQAGAGIAASRAISWRSVRDLLFLRAALPSGVLLSGAVEWPCRPLQANQP